MSDTGDAAIQTFVSEKNAALWTRTGIVDQDADPAVVTWTAFIPSASTSARIPLTADTTFYVREGGDDTHDGLAEATALATLGKALKMLHGVDPRGHSVIINIDGDVSSEGTVEVGVPGFDSSNLYIYGATIDTAKAPVTLRTSNSGGFSITNLQIGSLQALQADGPILIRNPPGIKATPVMRFIGSVPDLRALYAVGGSIRHTGTPRPILEFSGSYTYGFFADCGEIFLPWSTIKAIGTPHFSTDFAYAARAGKIILADVSFEGTATGRKGSIYEGGILAGDIQNFFGDQTFQFSSSGNRWSYTSMRGVARAGASINGTNGAIDRCFGSIESSTRNSVGDYTITHSVGAGGIVCISSFQRNPGNIACNYTSTSINVRSYDSNGTAADRTFAMVIF